MPRSAPQRLLRGLAVCVLLALASRASRAGLRLIPHVDRLGPDPHQGGLWTCSCCALTCLVEWHRLDATGEHLKLSPMHLYRHSQQYRMIEGCFEGGLMDMSYLVRIASLHGVVPESRYPYRLQTGSMRQPINRQWPRDMSKLATGRREPSPPEMLDYYFPPPVSIGRPPADGFFLRRKDLVLVANSKLLRYAADWVRAEEGQPDAFIDYNVQNYKSARYLAVAFDKVYPSAAKLFDRLVERLDAKKPVLMGYMEDGVTKPVRGGKHWHFIVAVGHDPASGQVVARNSYGSQRLTTYSYAFLRAKLFQLVYCKADALQVHATPDIAGYAHLLGDKALDMEGVLGILGGQNPLPAKLVELGLSRQEAIVLLDLRAARGGRQLSRSDIDAFVADLRESVRTGRCSKLKWHPPPRNRMPVPEEAVPVKTGEWVVERGEQAIVASPAPAAARVPANWREGLASDDLLQVIHTLHALAEAGPDAREAEGDIAELLTADARGKILSRWCYRALAAISKNPVVYVERYVAAAGWLHYNVAGVGDEGVIGGPTPDMVGPEIPEVLRSDSRHAWIAGVETVIRLLRSSDGAASRRLKEVLEKMGAPEDVMVPRLAEVMLDRTVPSLIREQTARIIGNYGHSAASMEPLLAGIGDENPRVRVFCARSLGGLAYPYDFYGSWRMPPVHPRPGEALGALVALLKDPDAHVRHAAVSGLGAMRHEAVAAVENLVRTASGDADLYVRYAAMYALGQVGGSLRQNRSADFPAVARAAVPILINALRLEPVGKQRHLVLQAASSLGDFGEAASAAVPELHRLLRDEGATAENQRRKGTLISTLGRIGPASAVAVPDIIEEARHRRMTGKDCRYQAAAALGTIGRGGDEVERLLLGLTRANEHWIRRKAAISLGLVARESEEVVKALERLLHDSDEDVREESGKALKAVRARAAGVDIGVPEDEF